MVGDISVSLLALNHVHIYVNTEIKYLSPLIQYYWLIRYLPAKLVDDIDTELIELNNLSQF